MRVLVRFGAVLGTAAVAVSLAGCQSGSPGAGSGIGAPGVPMTIPQIETLLVGNSLETTTTDGRTSCAFHSTETHNSNSMIVVQTVIGGAQQGFYRVERPNGAADAYSDPGLICYSFPDAGVFADCRSVRQSGSIAPGVTSVALYDRDGALRATGTVRAGDTCGPAL